MNADSRSYLKVIQYIRQQLICERLRLGDKLPTERELSEILDLSRNSIREALRTMDNMGIIESRQGSGNYLTGNIEKSFADSLSMMVLIKQVSYLEINQLRRGIEIQSLFLAIDRITNDELLKIDKILITLEHSKKGDEVIYDKDFHDAIIAASGNRLMVNIMQALSVTCKEVIEHTLNQVMNSQRLLLISSHRKIYESLLTKDLTSGVKAVNVHYDIIDSGLKID